MSCSPWPAPASLDLTTPFEPHTTTMSTPSTAIATHTLPPHQQCYSHHQAYQPQTQNAPLQNGAPRVTNPAYNGYPTGASRTELRRTAAVNARQPPLPPPASGYTSADMDSARRDKRQPNWEEFFKNGPPKEIIVIDDDTPEPASQPSIPPAPNGTTRHSDKKRKTAATTNYDPVYHQQTSYSTTQTPYYDGASTASTDRTSALGTTAPTSLGSNGSRACYAAPVDEGVTGQKRKRRTKADDESEAKRREIDLNADPFEHYFPPKKPVQKSKEVYVQVVPDVSFYICMSSPLELC